MRALNICPIRLEQHCTPVLLLTHIEHSCFSEMAHFIEDSSSSSSDSSSSSASGSESEPELNCSGFNVVRPETVKSNEAGPGAQNTNPQKEREITEKDSEGGSKDKQKDRKTNKKTKKANSAKNQESQKEDLTPERTVRLVKKIIAKNKKQVAKDKTKLNKLLKSASAAARKYKVISNKATKRTS